MKFLFKMPMQTFQSMAYALFVLIVIGVFIYRFFKALNPSKYSRLMDRYENAIKSNPYYKDYKKINEKSSRVTFFYDGVSILLTCNLELKTVGSGSDGTRYYVIEFNYQLDFTDPKDVTNLELIKTFRFINYIIPSTVRVAGNENKVFRVIYQHNTGTNKQLIRQKIEQLVSFDEIKKLKRVPHLLTLEVDSGRVTVKTNNVIENNDDLRNIFELMKAISRKKVTKTQMKESSEMEVYSIKVMKVVLEAVSSNVISDDTLFESDFSRKFRDILVEFQNRSNLDGVKINVSVTRTANVRIKDKDRDKNTWKVVITDQFPVKTVPFVKRFENNDGTKGTWTLYIDKNSRKLKGMHEDIWGNYKIK